VSGPRGLLSRTAAGNRAYLCMCTAFRIYAQGSSNTLPVHKTLRLTIENKVTIKQNVHRFTLVKSTYKPSHPSGRRLSLVSVAVSGWDAIPSQGYPSALNLPGHGHLYTGVERGTMRLKNKCLAQEHNTMCLARARTWRTQAGVMRTNHQVTTPPHKHLTSG